MGRSSMVSQNLRDFVYLPSTVWREFFRPTYYFGCNVNDVDVEQEVLAEVGSYGKQLNKILDALVVLIKVDEDRMTGLTEDEKLALYALKSMQLQASKASSRAAPR